MSDSDTALRYSLTLRVICRTVPSMFSMMLANARGRNLGRKFVRAVFTMAPENLQGLAEFYLRPTLAQGLGPFNGQVIRQRIFEKIFCEFHVERIVETGTYRGTTTEYFATFGVPVLSVEVSRRYFAYSCQRLAHSPNVSLYNANSVRFLTEQVALGTFLKGFTIFYLDAHWEERLPLRDELEIVCGNVHNHVIVIDDFEVPNDLGYGFDDFGPGKRLSVDYLKTVSGNFDLYVFFPRAPSSEETGNKRGSAFITASSAIAETLKSLTELRFFEVISASSAQSPDPIPG